MTRGLRNPNSIQALNELKNEMALELSTIDRKSLDEETRTNLNKDLNRQIVSRSRFNLIGFK
ncbi:hypothetical protein [Brassicibacter mesophilus]|uniref:hypothetical protein n=1 Tax=Brassicibacter mesophilus TaxID=745119 RepID=UPI003D205B53